MLLIANVIAGPAAFFVYNLWLEKLAYHVSVDVITGAIGVITLVVFGIAIIGSQAWRAIYAKPVENLMSE
jgi:putative ABC transport system permease protein